jgi:hypothetical protein
MANPTIDGGGPKLKTQGPSNYWFVGSGIQTNYLVEITGTTRAEQRSAGRVTS